MTDTRLTEINIAKAAWLLREHEKPVATTPEELAQELAAQAQPDYAIPEITCPNCGLPVLIPDHHNCRWRKQPPEPSEPPKPRKPRKPTKYHGFKIRQWEISIATGGSPHIYLAKGTEDDEGYRWFELHPPMLKPNRDDDWFYWAPLLRITHGKDPMTGPERHMDIPAIHNDHQDDLDNTSLTLSLIRRTNSS